jgi:hypothetical protein
MSASMIRLELLKHFWERKMSTLERYHDLHPLQIPPLGLTMLFHDIVRGQAEQFKKSLYLSN